VNLKVFSNFYRWLCLINYALNPNISLSIFDFLKAPVLISILH